LKLKYLFPGRWWYGEREGRMTYYSDVILGFFPYPMDMIVGTNIGE